MMVDPIFLPDLTSPTAVGGFITVVGLIVAFVIFARLAIKYWKVDGRRFRSLKFGISLAVLLWVIPEAILIELPVPLRAPFRTGVALWSIHPFLHTSSMALLTAVIVLRGRHILHFLRR